jgi:DNA-directed RNA polymerase subunit beta'
MKNTGSAVEAYGNKFEAGIGAEAVKTMLEDLDLDALEYNQLRKDMRATKSVAKRQKLAKRLKIVDAFRKSGVDPTWMIMDVIPVLPPGFASPWCPWRVDVSPHPISTICTGGSSTATIASALMDLNAPDIIVRNEKRMLQEAVDVLFDNGGHGRKSPVPTSAP